MNKRIVSLFLSLIMVLGVILTGCSGGEDVGNTEDVTEEASTSTVTLKMYVVSEKEVSEETAKRINTAFNKITKSNFKTQVNICFCTYDTYYETLNAVFAENERYAALKEEAAKHLRDAKRAAKNEGIDISDPAWLDAYYAANPQYAEFREEEEPDETTDTTEEETVMEEVEGADGAAISVLKYPDERANQIDIFWFGGFDRYIDYIEKGYLAELDDHVGSKLKEYVNPDLLAWTKHLGDGMTYAIPNNNVIGEYTYLLLNKKLIDHYSYDPATLDSLADCDKFLKDVKTYNPEVIPVIGELPVVNAHYWNYNTSTNRIEPTKFSVLVSSTYSNLIRGEMDLDLGYNKNLIMSVSNIFRNPDYVSQLRTIQTYKDLGYVTADVNTDKEYALRVVKGGAELAEIYGDDYYMNVLERPRITEDDVCASMFGVSAYSNNVGRAMEIITYLNTNQGLRNILQYGVKDVDYTLAENGSVVRLNDSYMMDIEKTGNVFIAYPEEGIDYDVWAYGKRQNYEAMATLSLGFWERDPSNLNVDGSLPEGGPSSSTTTDESGNTVPEEIIETRLAVYLMPEVARLSAEVEAKLKAVKNLDELNDLITTYTRTCQLNTAVSTHASSGNPDSIAYYYMSWMLNSGFNDEIVLE